MSIQRFLLATILLSSLSKPPPLFASATREQKLFLTQSSYTTHTSHEPRAGNWKIFNRDGALCMRMTFAAQFNISYKTKHGEYECVPVKKYIDQDAALISSCCKNRSHGLMKRGYDKVAINIDPDSATVASACDNTERFFFLYPFGAADALWYIRLTFDVKTKHYYLTEVKTGWRFDKTQFKDGDVPYGNSTWETAKSDNFLHEPVLQGLTYACSEDLIVTTHVTSLRLTQIRFQPFAEECKDKSDCPDVECQILDNQKLVVGVAVLLGIVVVVALVGIAACAIKRSKTKLPPYYNIQDG